jgi:eukaryotic-like serine/threonine-protein kinase
MALQEGSRLGPYQITAPLGTGGMGQVYRAYDSRLGRQVAIKTLPAEFSSDAGRRQRFEREARAIAALNHPNICTIYDIGAQDGVDYLVMELLDGESLAERLIRGPLSFTEVQAIAHAMLATLAAVHDQHLIHRDLKPANIFLTRHGVKLLDFGLARTFQTAETLDTALTQQGVLLGTPRYMAPEQVRGGPIDYRADLFSAAAVIHEMLAGTPPFSGASIVDLIHAIAYEDPAPLPSGVAPPAFEQVLRHGLEKKAADRPVNARAFAEALASAATSGLADLSTTSSMPRPPLRTQTRVMVMPFRLLRPDPETDFLGFSLADAVAASIAGLESIVVCSTLTAMQFADGPPNLNILAERASVNAVLTGSLLRVGQEVRVSAQLVEAPGGALLWSRTIQAPVQDLFQLQDALTNAIVSSLEVPLTAREHRALRQDVPASATAYELYLRANQLMIDSSRWSDVRSLYEQAVVLDPGYAPAWARLGRVLRVLAKYGDSGVSALRAQAERAFERALALNPDLAMAHHLYAHLEAETGRASDAMVRLLTRARSRRSDPDLFAGLVTTCRYCGLLDESAAAFAQACRLDPAVRTSVAYTYYIRGDYPRAVETDAGSPAFAALLARFRLGDRESVLAELADLQQRTPHEGARLVAWTYAMAMERRVADLRPAVDRVNASGFSDPEGIYLFATQLAYAGATREALEMLDRAVTGGFCCPAPLIEDPYWAPYQTVPEFVRLLSLSQGQADRAREAFVRAGGPAVLALPSSASARQ